MTDAEHEKLNARVATEIMGWTLSPDKDYWMHGKEVGQTNLEQLANRSFSNGCVYGFRPSTSLDHCAIAECKMEELGLRREYIEAVQASFGASNPVLHPSTKLYRLLTAKPDVRCRAMLAAKKGSGGKK